MVLESSAVIPSESVSTDMSVATPNMIKGEAADDRFVSLKSMADLKEKAPEVYQQMMKGIALNICRSMQDHQKRLKEIIRKAREHH